MEVMTKKQQELVTNNLGLLYNFIEKFNLKNYDKCEDWYGRLSEALCRAAVSFDEEKGYRFSTYAYKAMFRELSRGTRKDGERVKNEIPYDSLKIINDEEIIIDNTKIFRDKTEYGNAQKGLEDKEFIQNFNKILEKLPENHQKIVYERFFLDKEYKDIGKKYGISKQRVAQICKIFCKRYATRYKITNYGKVVM